MGNEDTMGGDTMLQTGIENATKSLQGSVAASTALVSKYGISGTRALQALGVPARTIGAFARTARGLRAATRGLGAMVIDGTLNDLSSKRAVRLAALTDQTNVAALANGALCAPISRDLPDLDDLREGCRADPITPEMVTQAQNYRLLGPIMTICQDTANSRGCYRDLAGFHHETHTCDRPLIFPDDADWYGSKFFETCLAAYAPE